MADYIFGITGPTGAGKSTVSGLFKENGIFIADADKAARAVVEPGLPCLRELAEAFGDGILDNDGGLNRQRLAQTAFADKNNLKLLNKITHSYITEYIEAQIAASGAEIAAIDGAVIIGSPAEKLCRMLVTVTADRETRLLRIMARDGLSRDAAAARIAAQPSDEEYIRHGKYNIDNNGDISRIGVQVEYICNKIKAEAKAAKKAQKEKSSRAFVHYIRRRCADCRVLRNKGRLGNKQKD